MTSIVTYSGKTFSLSDPKFDFVDIGRALSKLCRFNGHTSQLYTVAQHSMLVSDIMDRYLPGSNVIEGFLHDAHEAYISDVPKPFKQLLPGWDQFEKRIEALFWQSIPVHKRPLETNSKACKYADAIALMIEASLFVSGGPYQEAYQFNIEGICKAEENYRAWYGPGLNERQNWPGILHSVLTNLSKYQYMFVTDTEKIYEFWYDKLCELGL